MSLLTRQEKYLRELRTIDVKRNSELLNGFGSVHLKLLKVLVANPSDKVESIFCRLENYVDQKYSSNNLEKLYSVMNQNLQSISARVVASKMPTAANTHHPTYLPKKRPRVDSTLFAESIAFVQLQETFKGLEVFCLGLSSLVEDIAELKGLFLAQETSAARDSQVSSQIAVASSGTPTHVSFLSNPFCDVVPPSTVPAVSLEGMYRQQLLNKVEVEIRNILTRQQQRSISFKEFCSRQEATELSTKI